MAAQSRTVNQEAANSIASFIPPLPPVLTQRTWALLLVTTFGILLSTTKLREVPGTEPLAMAFVYIYMTMIGASADLRALGGAQWFIVAGFVTIAIVLSAHMPGAGPLARELSWSGPLG